MIRTLRSGMLDNSKLCVIESVQLGDEGAEVNWIRGVTRFGKFRQERTMKVTTAVKPARDTLNLRIPAAARNLIDRAASSTGKTRTDFILDAARRAAEEALLDRALVSVTPEAYAEFLKRLDAPAQPNAQLRKTMQSPPPWARP